MARRGIAVRERAGEYAPKGSERETQNHSIKNGSLWSVEWFQMCRKSWGGGGAARLCA